MEPAFAGALRRPLDMKTMWDSLDAERAVSLARTALLRPLSPFDRLPSRLIVVDVRRQRLSLLRDGAVVHQFPVSTARAGVGGEEGSNRTPPGWHRVHARIGEGASRGARFESRELTGAVWNGETVAEDWILTRVLTLEGLEEGVNRGAGRDSLARYIYIHGTNHESEIGRAVSHGCIRMRNDDVLTLFEAIQNGDPVVIVEGTLGVFA